MKKLLVSLAVLLTCLSANAVNYLVETGKTGDATWNASVAAATGAQVVNLATLQQSVGQWLTDSVTATGQEIWFAAGTYTFSASYSNKAQTKFIGGFAGTETNLKQRQRGAEAWSMTNATVFDGNGSVKIFSFNGAAGTVLDGIIIQNSSCAGNAGVIRPGNNSEIRNCQFKNNKVTTATGQGGAIQVYNANITIEDCLFDGNESGQGGAVFINNKTQLATIEGCLFRNNFVHATGAANAGGAVQLQGDGKSVVNRCWFEGNHTDGVSQNGSALSNAGNNTETAITNCIFVANAGVKQAVFSQNPGLFANNTLVNNEGGAIYATKGIFTNNIVWAETMSKASVSMNAAAVTCKNNAMLQAPGASCVVSGTIMLDSVNANPAEGLTVPGFVDAAAKNFALSAGSAMIDAGETVAVALDYLGMARPAGNGYDLGAFEYGAVAPTPTFTLTITVSVGGSVIDVATSSAAEASYVLEQGDTKTFRFVANEMYAVSEVLYNGANVTAQLVNNEFTIPAITDDATLSVTFAAQKASLRLECNYPNLLTYNNAPVDTLYKGLSVGAVMTFNYTLPQYYTLKKVLFNNQNITVSATDNTITTPAINGKDTLSITFEYREPLADETSKVVYVKVGGTGDGSTWATAMGDIVAAVREAKYDPTNVKNVWIAAGTYPITKTITISDSVSIYGGFVGTETSIDDRQKGANPWEYTNPTVLDGQSTMQIMHTGKQAMLVPVVIDGVTFYRGYAGNESASAGGATNTAHNVTIQNCKIMECTCDRTAGNGGAGGIQVYPAGDIMGCYFYGNRQTEGVNGGGAIHVNTSSLGYNVHISQCIFESNFSSIRGAAMNIQGQSEYYVDACTMFNNTVEGADSKGGSAIYDNGANMSHITNCVIYNNTGGAVVYLKPKFFAHNTIVKNAGQVYVAAGTVSSKLLNNVVWACYTDNTAATATSISGVACTGLTAAGNYTYNPLPTDKGWVLTDSLGRELNFQFMSNQTNGDVTVADTIEVGSKLLSGPKFRKVTTFIGAVPQGLSSEDAAIFTAEFDSVDYQLNAASPLVNAGVDAEYVAQDRNGDNRPQGKGYDVGAYELSYMLMHIGDYSTELGGIYDEEGVLLEPSSDLWFARGQEAILYFLSNSGMPVYKVTTTATTDGGLTFDGDVTDVTAELDEDSRWTKRIYSSFQLDVVWEDGTNVDNVRAATLGAEKVLRDGRIVIIRSGEQFDVVGRKL